MIKHTILLYSLVALGIFVLLMRLYLEILFRKIEKMAEDVDGASLTSRDK